MSEDTELHNDSLADQAALDLYKKGVDFEMDGYLDEAVEMYKRAMKINPYIEKVYHEKFQKDELNCENAKSGEILEFNPSIQETDEIFNLINLPDHVISQIFESIVTIDLDYSYLSKLSLVCKKFQKIADSAYLWKMIAMKIFRKPQETLIDLFYKPPLPLSEDKFYGYGSWKELVINHPHVLTNGIYASKIEYDHRGGQSIDQRTNALLPSRNSIVRYFRILRFFNDGYVHMMTTTTPLKSIMNSISSHDCNNTTMFDSLFFFRLHPSKGEVNELPDVTSNYWVGNYIFTESKKVLCKFVKLEKTFPREPIGRRSNFRPITCHTIKKDYLITVQIAGNKTRGPNTKLAWSDYKIEKLNFQTKNFTSSDVETNNFHFQSFYHFKINQFSDSNFPFIRACDL